jgi:hypothetical protein
MYLGFVLLQSPSKKLFTPFPIGPRELVAVGIITTGGGGVYVGVDGHVNGLHGLVKVGLTIFLYSSYDVIPGAGEDDQE